MYLKLTMKLPIAYQLPFLEPEFKEKWLEWVEYRKERRLAAYKPIGLKKTFTMLVRESGNDVNEAIDMLEYSMENNYQGIFKRKTNGTNWGTNTGSGQKLGTSAARIEALKRW